MSLLRPTTAQHFFHKLFIVTALAIITGCASQPAHTGYRMNWSTVPPKKFNPPVEQPIDIGQAQQTPPVLVSEVREDLEPALPPAEAFDSPPPTFAELDDAMLETVKPQDREVVLKVEQGIVSHYGKKWRGKTASGERFNPETMTAAHKTLPFGTIVRVTRLDTLASVVVRINNRGPYIKGRIIDLAQQPARMLGLMDKGIAPCRIEVLEYPPGKAR